MVEFITISIALISLGLSIYNIYRQNNIKLIESIPVLLIDNEYLFNEFIIYDVDTYGDVKLPIIIENVSDSNAFQIDVNIKIDYEELVSLNLAKKIDNETYRLEFSNNLIVINPEDGSPSFFIKKANLNEITFRNDLLIKYDVLTSQKDIIISKNDQSQLNSLMKLIIINRENGVYFNIPFSVTISYMSSLGEVYKTIYNLEMQHGGGGQIPLGKEFVYTYHQFQVIKKSMSSTALERIKDLESKRC